MTEISVKPLFSSHCLHRKEQKKTCANQFIKWLIRERKYVTKEEKKEHRRTHTNAHMKSNRTNLYTHKHTLPPPLLAACTCEEWWVSYLGKAAILKQLLDIQFLRILDLLDKLEETARCAMSGEGGSVPGPIRCVCQLQTAYTFHL